MRAKKLGKCILGVIIIVLSLLASVKMMILGCNIDEEYAITMGYRMVSGDRMFLEMWEPHQMSAFICAFFIWIYKALFHTTDYLLLYIRGIGVLIQTILSLSLFLVFRQKFSNELSLWAALLVFNALPKWTLVPEFSNSLLWCNLATMTVLCQYAFSMEKTGKAKKGYLIAGAVFYCGSVLCYPSAILMLPVYLIGLFWLTPKAEKKKIWIFPITCVFMGVAYVSYFLSHMSIEKLLYGISQMMTDGKHSYTLWERMCSYGREVVDLMPYILLVTVLPLVLSLIVHVFSKEISVRSAFCVTAISLSCILQFVVWLGKDLYLNHPLVMFYVIFIVGFLCPGKEKALLWFGSLPSGAALLAVLVLTNTDLRISGMQLLPGMICTGCFLWTSAKEKAFPVRAGVIASLALVGGLFLFAKGWLIYETGGYKADLFFVKQKALYGPAKNVYCRYSDGYPYNQLKETLEGYVRPEDAVLYVGKHSLRYLLTEGEISAFSTISTPTFDERLWDYWDRFPEKYPTVIIVEPDQEGWEDIRVNFSLLPESLEVERIRIYFTDKYQGAEKRK